MFEDGEEREPGLKISSGSSPPTPPTVCTSSEPLDSTTTMSVGQQLTYQQLWGIPRTKQDSSIRRIIDKFNQRNKDGDPIARVLWQVIAQPAAYGNPNLTIGYSMAKHQILGLLEDEWIGDEVLTWFCNTLCFYHYGFQYIPPTSMQFAAESPSQNPEYLSPSISLSNTEDTIYSRQQRALID